MTTRLIKSRMTIILLIVSLIITMIPFEYCFAEPGGESAPQEQTEQEEEACSDIMPADLPDPVTEDVDEEDLVEEESTETTSTFDLGDGEKMLVLYGQDVRFEDEKGDLVDYDPELVEVTGDETMQGRDLTGYAYENKVSDHKQYMPEDISETTPILMEKGDLAVEMSPVTEGSLSGAELEKDTAVSADEELEKKDLKVSYEDEGNGIRYTYTSQNDGLKEDIVLTDKPESNLLTFRLRLTGLTPVKTEEGGIVLTDENGEEKADITGPFMNDASGDAYSEDLDLDIEETEENDTYLLKMTVSRKYLNSRERVYPVTIDPSVTWRGSDYAIDTYVYSNNPNHNYHSTSVKVIKAGKNSSGTFRSFLKYTKLAGKVKGKYVVAARLVIYETNASNSNKTIGTYGVKAAWKSNNITWNNKPGYYSTVLGTGKTNGNYGHAIGLSVTDWARDVANESKTNYGIMVKNTTEPGSSYTEFCNTRHGTAKYRPKLVVTYTDGPTKASSVSAEKTYVKRNNTIKVSWKGIKSSGLAHIQYRVAKIDPDTGETLDMYYVPYTNFSSAYTASSGTNVPIPNSSSFPEGKYRIYIRGIDNGGIKGTGVGVSVVADGTSPVINDFDIDPETHINDYTGIRTPELSWDITEKYLSEVKVIVDSEEAGVLSAGSTDSYILPYSVIRESGLHTIHITAVDKAGNSASTQDRNYYVDIDPPEIGSFGFTPSSAFDHMSNNAFPVMSWNVSDEDMESVTVYRITEGELEEVYEAGNNELLSGSYTLQTGDLHQGKNRFRLEAVDSGGNVRYRTCSYYLDTVSPAAERLEITPGTGYFNSSAVLTPVISWSYVDQAVSGVKYSMDGISYSNMGTSKVGSFTMPESCFSGGAGTYTIYVKAVDTAGNESSVSTLTYHLESVTENDLIPSDIAVSEYYGKNVLTWEADGYCPSLGKVKIYRGDTASFDISDGELIEGNADNGMYTDAFVSSGSVYYRIVVVSEASDHHIISQSGAVQGASMLRASDLTNKTGTREYLGYHEFSTPSGTGYVELSSGNLRYSEADYSISNGQQDYGLTRSYNSLDGRTTAFGTGVSDSYHKTLYEDASGDVYYVDGEGSVYKFILNNGAYSLEEGKDYTLTAVQDGYEIEDKDHDVISFDKAGRVTCESEPNGIEVTYIYDALGRLERVKSKADTAGDREIRLHYENDSMLVRSISLPDDTLMKYSYTNDMLTAVSHIRNTDLIAVPYVRYTYGNGRLTVIEDALENEYEITYTNDRVTEIEDPLGEKDEVAYGNTVTVTHRTQAGAEFGEAEYSLDSLTGKVLWEEDVNGSRTSYEYTQSNDLLVKKVKTRQGWEEVDGSGNISIGSQDSVTETEYTYNSNEDVTLEEESDGTSTVTTYDQDSNVSREKEYSGEELTSDTEYEYDECGNEVEAEEHVTDTLTLTEYDDEGNETEEEEQEEDIVTDVTTSEYDDFGNAVETVTVSGGVETEGRTTYDGMGRTLREVSENTVTEYTYDVFGRVIRTDISRSGHTFHTYTSYDDNGNVISETDERGNVTSYSYDAAGRCVYTDSPASGITVTGYGYAQNVTIKDGLSGRTYDILKTEILKDDDDNILSIRFIDRNGETVRERTGDTYVDHTYDASGNDIVDVTCSDNSQEELISMSLFDEKGQRYMEVRKPDVSGNGYRITADSIVSSTSYTDTGDVDTEEDALGNRKRYQYDEQGRVTGVLIGSGQDLALDMAVSYSISESGSQTQMTDGNGNMRRDTESHAGLTVLCEDIGLDGEMLRLSSEYDEKGRKTSDTYSDGSRIQYTYDQYDRLVSREYTDLHNVSESTTAYTYTQYGEPETVTYTPAGGPAVTKAYQYDTCGRITRETSTYGNDAPSVVEYVYDSRGRVSTLKYPSQAAGISGLSYEYDTLGRISKIKTYQGNDTVRRYTYGPFGRISFTRDYVIGTNSFLKTVYGYDSIGRVVSKEVKKNSTSDLIESYEVEYDKLDRITELTRMVDNGGDSIYETRTYVYDDHGRLIQSGVLDNFDEPEGDETIEDLIKYTTYEYDAAGNCIQVNDEEGTSTFTYNGLNQLISQDAPEKEVEFSYDSRGNRIEENDVTNGVITHNDYTVEGQLTRVSEEDANGTTVIQQNAYDSDGTRVQKTEGNDVKKYYYAGDDMIATTEGADTVFTGMYGNGNEMISAFLGASPDLMIYCKDMQGSTSVLADTDFDISGGYSYSDYGEVTGFDGTPDENEICYTGAVYDRTTGEHYLRARYYDPDTAVFTAQDTYRGEATDESLWNLYAYCGGDPIDSCDPSGHYSVNKAIQYALDWASNTEYLRNPKYDDYSDEDGEGGDCTNFVSQCIHEGGKPMDKPKSHPSSRHWKTTKYWFAKMPPRRPYYFYSTSTSWTVVDDLFSYFKNKGGAKIIDGKKGKGIKRKTLQRKGKLGDIVQLKANGIWYHSIILTGGKRKKWRYSAHTTDRRNVKVSSIGDYNRFRIIRIR